MHTFPWQLLIFQMTRTIWNVAATERMIILQKETKSVWQDRKRYQRMQWFLLRKNFVTKFKVPTLPLSLIETFIRSIKAAAMVTKNWQIHISCFVFIYGKTLWPMKCFPPNMWYSINLQFGNDLVNIISFDEGIIYLFYFINRYFMLVCT